MAEERVKLGQDLQGRILSRDIYKERDTLLLSAGKVLTKTPSLTS